MTSASSEPADYQDRISRREFEQLVSVRGEGDEWDFKQTLSGLVGASARVELAKDALAFCNLPVGGTIIVGVTDDYQRVGLANSEKIDTTAIRNAIEKYIDGDFIVVAAEHTMVEPGTSEEKRYGMIYFRRRFAQPVLAALDGQIASDRPLVFRSGDILIRRGAASIRANSGDVRRLFTSSIVHEERIKAVNELWNCLVEQRRLMGGVEFIYDILADSEYPEVFSKPDFRDALGRLTEGQHASQVDRLRLRVNLVRPYLPEDLYQQYGTCAALVGRLHMKAIQQRDAGVFLPWTEKSDGSPDLWLQGLALELIPGDELAGYWSGRDVGFGTFRPVRPVLDAAERGLLTAIRLVLSGLG